MSTTLAPFCYWGGNIVSTDAIRIDPLDIGLLRGYGVFDVMRTENDKPFLIECHFARLVRSAETLPLTLPVNLEEYHLIGGELLERNTTGQQMTIRTVLTGGPSASGFLPEPGSETFFIVLMPFLGLEERYYTEGATIMTVEHARNFPRAKITNYITAIAHATERIERGALELLFIRGGQALEASTSNFMIVQDGRLITPGKGILMGITRGLVLELARGLGMEAEERDVTLEEVLQADEAFLTATNKYIVPVVAVDDQRIGDGRPGEVTKKLMAAMREYVAKY